jgi:response regulator RpfG family c-di-GMP phosphodiesterase
MTVPRHNTNDKILLVDDDSKLLSAMERGLRLRFNLVTAEGGEDALAKMDMAGPFAVIITDMQMPGMNGVQLLTEVQRRYPETVRIMFTGNAEQRTAAEAVNIGHIFEFLSKPCGIEPLTLALQAGLKQYHLVIAERELLEKTLKGSIKVLVDVLSAVDPLSFGHGEALGAYLRTYAQGQAMTDIWELEMGAMLSQIGMVTVPPAVIEKFRTGMKLTMPEREMIERVPKTGADLLANIPRLEAVARMVLYQNKHYNGAGFPADDVRGEDIPIGSRILKLLQDLLELEAQKLPKDTALRLLQDRRGWYDPRVLDATFACFNVALPDSSARRQGQAIAAKDLRAGQVVLTDIQTEAGKTLVLARSRLTPVLLLRVANFAQFNPIQEPIYIETLAGAE